MSLNKNVLEKTRTYLVGHMQYANGRDWREEVERELLPLNIKIFNPYDKPFVKDVDEDESARLKVAGDMGNGFYEDVAARMKEIRSYDLNLVDRSDFIIAHLLPDVASWGSAEEIVTAVRMKKPIFISMEGGKKETPLWMMGMLPHHYIYDSIEDVINMEDLRNEHGLLAAGSWEQALDKINEKKRNFIVAMEKNGENIANLNRYFSEWTGLYWIWKNRLNGKDKNDWIGSCGYRKLWLNDLYNRKQKFSFSSLYSNLLNPNNEIFKNCDVVQVQPIFLKNETVFQQFEKVHKKNILEN